MKRPTLEDIIMVHEEIVAQSGGLEGIRDINLIDSAINSPFLMEIRELVLLL